MAQYRSTYDVPSHLWISAGGARSLLTCAAGGEVTVPDVFDRLVPKQCPGWKKVEPKAPEAAKPEAPKAEAPKPAQQHQQHHKGGK